MQYNSLQVMDNTLIVGNGTDQDVSLDFDIGAGASNPSMSYSASSDSITFNNAALEINSMDIAGDLVVEGSLTVKGSSFVTSAEIVELADNTILLNAGLTGASTESAGIEIERGSSANVSFLWDETADKWSTGTESIIANTFEGDFSGHTLTLINDADIKQNAGISGTLQVGGTFDAAGVSTFANTVTVNEAFTVADDKASVLGGTAQIKLAATFDSEINAKSHMGLSGNLLVGADLDVGGASELVGTVAIGDVLTVAHGKATTLGGTLSAKGDVTLDGNVSIDGSIDAKAHMGLSGNLLVGADLDVAANLDVTGVSTLADSLTVAHGKATTLGGTLSAKGAVTVDDTLLVTDTATFNGSVLVDTITEKTTDAGVTIEGIHLENSRIDQSTLTLGTGTAVDVDLIFGADTNGALRYNVAGDKMQMSKDNSTFIDIAGTASTVFTSGNIAGGNLTFTHNLQKQYVNVILSDNTGQQQMGDVTYTSTTVCTIDMSNYGTLVGNWNVTAVG